MRLPPGGFTLVEALVVVVIVAIMAAVAMPNLSSALATQRLRAAGTDLVSTLLLARSEAIKRGAQVQVAPVAAGDWKSGWRVVATGTGEQVEKTEALGHWVEVGLAPATITFERNGRLSVIGSTRVEFRDIAGATGVASRCVTIDPSGMPRLVASGCT
ncbi:MAG: GspH/FimT family pseudopilin [Casimicrobiaceae bacterium]